MNEPLKTESPLETMLILALLNSKVGPENCRLENYSKENKKRDGTYVVLQYEWNAGRYRSDFAVMVDGVVLLLVECDGHEFHSTPEQADADTTKDREALKNGMATARFTSKRIFNDPFKCVHEISQIVNAIAERDCSIRIQNSVKKRMDELEKET